MDKKKVHIISGGLYIFLTEEDGAKDLVLFTSAAAAPVRLLFGDAGDLDAGDLDATRSFALHTQKKTKTKTRRNEEEEKKKERKSGEKKKKSNGVHAHTARNKHISSAAA